MALFTSLSEPFQDSLSLLCASWAGFILSFCLSCFYLWLSFCTLVESGWLFHNWKTFCHRLGIALVCDMCHRSGISHGLCGFLFWKGSHLAHCLCFFFFFFACYTMSKSLVSCIVVIWLFVIFGPLLFLARLGPAHLSPHWCFQLLWAPLLSQMSMLCHLCH